MDSDSESQDSDDGRRFRFEATRKDDGAQRRKHQESSLRNQSRHKSRHLSSSDKSKREESYKESKYKHNDNSRSIILNSREDKDSKYMTKRSKDTHTSRGHRERSRDSKHYRDRDRIHKERSRDGKKSPINKHRHDSRERYRHSSNKSRDKSYRSDKIKPEDCDKLRDELNKKDNNKQIKTKPLKNDSHDESVQMNTSNCSLDNQSCREIDLSDYDVLSETDETFSDASDITNEKSLSTLDKTKIDPCTGNEICLEKQELENCHKVNSTNNDQLSGSSNNDSSTISDSTTSIITKNKEYENVEDKANETNLEACTKNYSDVNTVIPGTKTQSGSIYGPSLPPNLLSDSNCTDDTVLCENIENQSSIRTCSPLLNHETEISNSNENGQLESRIDDNSELCMETTEDLAFGPVLPPHLKPKEMDTPIKSKFVGPLPANLATTKSEDESLQADPESNEDEGIGPLPLDHPSLRNNHVHEQLELRAMNFHNELAEQVENDSNKREEWMVELPPAQAVDLGLGPRKFRMKAGPDMTDRTCWTDTPLTKAKKTKEPAEKKIIPTKEARNTIIKESNDKKTKNKKRERSLVEIHQENLAKKQKKTDSKIIEKSTRRPFNRDVDLQANRFDQAQKKAILKKAQMLDDRFARGKI